MSRPSFMSLRLEFAINFFLFLEKLFVHYVHSAWLPSWFCNFRQEMNSTAKWSGHNFRWQFPFTRVFLKVSLTAAKQWRGQNDSHDITIPLFLFSRTLNSHLTWHRACPLPPLWTDLITQLVPIRNQFWDTRSHFLDEGSHYRQGLYHHRRGEKQIRDKQYFPQTGLQ